MRSSPSEINDGDEDSNDVGMHMAFNYWYHPSQFNGTFNAPYEDSFWEDGWKEIEEFMDTSLADKLILRKPGTWIVRDKRSGEILGFADKATLPKRLKL